LYRYSSVLLLALCANFGNALPSLNSAPQVVSLRTEYFENPLSIDSAHARLSWQLLSSQRDVRQVAYQIQVARDDEDLKAQRNLIWDSAKVLSDRSIQIPYDGPALASRARCAWRVRVWTAHGHEGTWSLISHWEMGLLSPNDWTAQWISLQKRADAQPGEARLLRRAFHLQRDIVRARLYVTSHGLYQVLLNGSPITDDVLTPGWTSYKHRLQYQTYDVTDHLKEGDNAIGATLAEGWFAGTIAGVGQRPQGLKLTLLLQLEVTYADGQTERIGSDDAWRSSSGPILQSGIYEGETYDARLEKSGWSEAGYDDRDWHTVDTVEASNEVLIAPAGPPVRRIEEIIPKAIIKTPAGDTVIDMGQNMVGWVRLKVQGPEGTTVVLRHAEVLDASGNFYTQNLRTAAQTVRYTLKGGGEEVFEPHFTFQGFRYVAVQGWPGELTMHNITAVVVHSKMQRTGEFSTSNALVNQLQHNIIWGQKGNFVDVPTDCPQRDERVGWTGDAQVFSATAAFNMDVSGFFTKWLGDLKADQNLGGGVPFVVPDVLEEMMQAKMHRPAAGEPGWGDAATVIPWNMYLAYADTRLLKSQYDSMQAWVRYEQTAAGDELIWQGDFLFGDWLDYFSAGKSVDGVTLYAGATPKDLIATAYFAHSADILSRAAAVLGKTQDAKQYERLFAKITQAFNHRFVLPDGTVGTGTQTGYVLSLDFDLLPPDTRPASAAKLASDVRQHGHLTTGFLGTPHLLNVLTRFGYQDLSYSLLKREEFPSWLYPVKQGATTIWERWDGLKPDGSFQDAGMNSFNHYAYGAVGEWMYEVMGGINIDPKAPGYQHVLIHPQPGGDFTFVNLSHDSPYGRVSSHWRIAEGRFELNVEIPANSTASVRLPNAILSEITESGGELKRAQGVSEAKQEHSSVELSLGSGHYLFRYPWRPAT
jgi:alpha-L-rhamnosidase